MDYLSGGCLEIYETLMTVNMINSTDCTFTFPMTIPEQVNMKLRTVVKAIR